MKKIFSYLFMLVLVFSLVACGTGGGGDTLDEPNKLEYADGTELKMAVAHNNNATSISFKAGAPKQPLADGKTYYTDELKPVWAELEKVLNVTFKDVYATGKSAKDEFTNWQNLGYAGVDVLVGNADQMAEEGKKGNIVDLSQWLDYMPNFKAFLDENPIVKLSVVSDLNTGAIYYAPYFDGFDDIEKYFLMRIDWIQILLDGEGDYVADESDTWGAIIGEAEYTPYMPTSGSLEIESLNAAGTGTQIITKNYDTAYGNIADYINKHATAATTGVELVNWVRDYIDAAYGGYYGTTRSNLFAGNDAAWDADELVALLRCVVTNTYGLTGQNTNKVTGIFPREKELNRVSDLFSLVSLFGARGYESRHDYLYFNSNGELVDARSQEDYIEGIDKLNQLYAEGLILQNFDTATFTTKQMASNNSGFMLYDYVQTQSIYNEDADVIKAVPGYNLSAVMTPVAKWYDGSNAEGTYMRFTESWRSVKTSGWCIPSTCTGDALKAALKMFDYMYSKEGAELMSYGPRAWRSGETINYKGQQIPELSEAALEELWTLAGGSYTDYARKYLGSTLPIGFVKDQGMEYQCTTMNGRAGAEKVSNGIGLGTVKHVSPAISENLWYTMVPTTLPTTKQQDDTLKGYAGIAENGIYSKTKGKYSVYSEIIKYGLGSGQELSNSGKTYLGTMPADAAALIAAHEELGGNVYMLAKSGAWQNLYTYYLDEIKK